MTSDAALLTYTGPFFADCHACHGSGIDAAFGGSCSECPRRGTQRLPRTAERTAGAPAPRPQGGAHTGRGSSTAPTGPTARQAAFIERLVAERTGTTNPEHAAQLDVARLVLAGELALDTRGASALIDVLMAIPRPRPEQQAERPAAPRGARITAPGMFRRSSDGVIFKVQAARGTGNLYAKRLLDGGGFDYESGAIRTLTEDDRLTLDQAQAYGKATGMCCVCGTTLTDPKSIAAGIGPVCAGRL